MNVQDTTISPLHILAGCSSIHAYTAAQILLAQGANPNQKYKKWSWFSKNY